MPVRVLLAAAAALASCADRGKPRENPTEAALTHIADPDSALLVVGHLPLSGPDLVLEQRLTAAGLSVSLALDSASGSQDAAGKRLVVISESSLSSNVGTKFTETSVPVLTSEPAIYDDLGMTGPSWMTDYGDAQPAQEVVVGGTQHPLEVDWSGTMTVSSSPDKLIWGKPSADAQVVATLPGQASRAAIFVYEAGVQMVGRKAPARRVGFFAGGDTPGRLTAEGTRLLDAAIAWAMAPRALLVVEHLSLSASDTAVRDRLLALGLAPIVTTPSQLSASVGSSGAALIVISESVHSVDVGNRLRRVGLPLISLEPALFDDLGMTGDGWQSDFGDTQGATSLEITTPAHPLAAGLQGTVSTSAAAKYVWGTPGPGAIKIANIVGRPAQAAIFAYETGVQMLGLAAPARRVGFFAGRDTPKVFSSAGIALFDTAVRWAAGLSEVVTPIEDCLIQHDDGRVGRTIDVTASRRHDPPLSEDGIVSLDGPTAFRIPSTIPVIEGNAGNAGLRLVLKLSDGKDVECSYQGGASVSSPTTESEIAFGRHFVFSSCGQNLAAGHLLSVQGLRIHLEGGDPTAGVTKVQQLTRCSADQPPVLNESPAEGEDPVSELGEAAPPSPGDPIDVELEPAAEPDGEASSPEVDGERVPSEPSVKPIDLLADDELNL